MISFVTRYTDIFSLFTGREGEGETEREGERERERKREREKYLFVDR